MSRLIKTTNGISLDVPFNKEEIIEEIKKKLPEPWAWYVVTEDSFIDTYDLFVIRNKKVGEEINYERPFSSVRRPIHSLYSIVLGINVVEKYSSQERFYTEARDMIVTAAIEVNSSRVLFDMLREIDSRPGGIKDVV